MNLRPYQQSAYDATMNEFAKGARSTLVTMPTGCHRAGQGILMYDGRIKSVEYIEVGDVLMGPDSQPRRVLQLCRGRGEMVGIHPVKGKPWVVNKDHILTLIKTSEHNKLPFPCRRGGRIVDVSVRDYLKWSDYKKHVFKLFRQPAKFSARHTELPLDPHFLGIMIGDGSLAFRNTSLSVCTVDHEIMQIVRNNAAANDLSIRIEHAEGKAPQTYLVSDRPGVRNRITRYLKDAGLKPVKCEERFVPDEYLRGEWNVRLKMLAGLIDSDGSATCGGYDFISKSRRLSGNVAFLARSVGLAAYVSPCEKWDQNGNGGTYFRVSISGDCGIVPVAIERKKHPARKQKKDVLRTGFEVIDLEVEEDYFGFTLDGDGRYLLDDFTVTHNTGKTILFAHVANHFAGQGRVLVLAHREELIYQAANKIEAVTGEKPEIEMAEQAATVPTESFSFTASRFIVGSIQTQNASRREKKRMHRFDPSHFSLLIIDESHHSVSKSYVEVIDHYKQNEKLRILGVTATGDRSDGNGLGSVFESIAYQYELPDAVHDGWLVPIRQRSVIVDGLDFSKCRTLGGDFNQADLAAAMEFESALHPVVHASLERACGFEPGTLARLKDDPDRQQKIAAMLNGRIPRKALVFAVSVAQAERTAEIFNRWLTGCAKFICGETPKEERRALLKDYAAKRFQILVNVGVCCEGFDDPGIELVVMARPTKSRALATQQIGRGTRPLEEIAHKLGDLSEPSARRAMIEASAKTHVEILDFVGNSGKHRLVTAADILAGDGTEESILERAKEIAQAETIDVQAALERALMEAEEDAQVNRLIAENEAAKLAADDERWAAIEAAQRRAQLVATSEYRIEEVAHDLYGGNLPVRAVANRRDGATPKQIAFLVNLGIQQQKAATFSVRQAGAVIDKLKSERCTTKQAKFLRRSGWSEADIADMNFDRASAAIDQTMNGQRGAA